MNKCMYAVEAAFLQQMLPWHGLAKKEPDRALDDRRQRCTMPSCGRKQSPPRGMAREDWFFKASIATYSQYPSELARDFAPCL